MTNVQSNKLDGDNITPPVRESAGNLARSAEPTRPIPALTSPPPKANSKIIGVCTSIQNASNSKLPVGSCAQLVWFSFFFDGTGNNLSADFGLNKHSNVAKLYRAHKGEDNSGANAAAGSAGATSIYRIYIPGLGTYFREIGDEGIGYSNIAGLVAGWNGDARLAWALGEYDRAMRTIVQRTDDPKNKLIEVNISVFGFSRGAALARAFIHDFVANRCLHTGDGIWVLKQGNHRIRIRFMGLFDTVASAGTPMSGNNMRVKDAKGTYAVQRDNRFRHFKDTVPTVLAFAPTAAPGADPAPGTANGHVGWGDRMLIPDMVEEVRHFVAAHEVRNSFPLDSIQVMEGPARWRHRPNKFFEYVYAGVHSDVGGSYKPGEGGKNEEGSTKLGLLPLRAMFDFALDSGVPFLPESAWEEGNIGDFRVQDGVNADYKYYLKNIKPASYSLGGLFNAHMALYYAWRFHVIRAKIGNDLTEKLRIEKNSLIFDAQLSILERNVTTKKAVYDDKERLLQKAIAERESERNKFAVRTESEATRRAMDLKIAIMEREASIAKDNWLGANAKMAALPKMDKLPGIVDFYDAQLLCDAQSIYAVLTEPRLNSAVRKFATVSDTLRPHYRCMIEAYHNEFKADKGLRDKRIIHFFEEYIHDSVAGFAADATLRSDPRVIYVGYDSKLPFANTEPVHDQNSVDKIA